MTDPRDPDTPYIDAAGIRGAVTGLTDTEKYPDATLERFVSRFETLAENYRGVAFTPRAATETHTIKPSGRLILNRHKVTEVTSLAYNPGTAPAVELVEVVDGYEVAFIARQGFPCGTRVTVGFVHGYPEPPAAVIDACIEFVRAEAIQQKGSTPRNVTGERTDLGWIPEPTADPSKGRPTRWTVVNEALNSIQDERIPGLA